MKLVTWRNTALVLAAVCSLQRYQSCTREDTLSGSADVSLGETAAPASHASPSALPTARSLDRPSLAAPSPASPNAAGEKSFHGFKIPAWAVRLAPQHGETMRAYRDRILPLAEMAVAPQRARVARMRDEFANLDPRQRAELDGAVSEATQAIQDRVMAAFAGGELAPSSFKPMTGVAIARDVLDIVDRGNTRFQRALTPDQRTRLASHRFDFADYLLFTGPWKDALHALD